MKKLLFTLFLLSSMANLSAQGSRELVVTGHGKATTKATIADVKIAIEMTGKSSNEVQQAVSVRLKPVLDQLRGAQVEKLQTSVINIYPDYTTPNSNTISEYRGRIDISFTTPTERAPDLIDKAFKAGVNQLVSLSFRAADNAASLTRLTALQFACQDAQREAKTVMETLGIDASRILYVNVHPSTTVAPVQASGQGSASSEIKASTEILDQEQTIRAFVDIRFEIKE